jgi:type II secretory pathway component PulK
VAGIPLDDYELGGARISVQVADTDRKFNINVADEFILRQGLVSIGVDAGAHPTIVEAILDWRDPDDIPRVSGVESAYYLSLSPPHFAKNGPLDDLSELLLVRGVTPALYFGRSSGGPEPAYTTGLVDFFTPWSSRLVNLNTAPAAVLQIFPDLDANIAQAIITARAGLDGVDGTEDDQPFRSPQDIARVPGLNNPAAVQTLARYFTVRSLVFEVTIDLDLDGETREYAGWLTRTSPRDIRILKMYRN